MFIYYNISDFLEKGVRVKGLGTIPKLHDEVAKRMKEEGKFPVGTVRSWDIGDVIKKDDNTWVPIEIPDDIHKIGAEIQILCKEINWINKPLKGELVVDHVLHKYFHEDSLSMGEYKRFNSFGHFLGYDFDNGLYKEWVGNWFNGKEDKFIPMSKLEEIKEKLEEFKGLLKNEGGLSETDKKIYEGLKERIEDISEEYIPFFILKKNILGIMKLAEKFKDNFIINTILTLSLEDNFLLYKKNYSNLIKLGEKDRILKEAGISITDPTRDFYKKMQDYLIESKKEVNEENLSSSILEFSKRMQEESSNFVLEERYERVLGLQLAHDRHFLWNEKTIPALQNFELFALQVPRGHIIDNPNLKKLNNKNYDNLEEDQDYYAFYQYKDRSINLSKTALNYANIKGDLTDPDEFNSVIAHESGHAVAVKLREINNLDFKKFAKFCGWDYRIFSDTKYSVFATGNNKEVPRTGMNRNIPLLTTYSSVSPNEAFAEYYSFYFLNKDKLDKWLETGNEKDLILKGRKVLNKKEDLENEKKHIKQTSSRIIKKPIRNEKGKVINFIIELRPLTEKEIDIAVQRRSKGFLTYRNKDIYIDDIIKNYIPFKIMKERIFENEKLIKALQTLGVNILLR